MQGCALFMSKSHEVEKYTSMLSLMEKFSLSEELADQLIEKSNLVEMLNEDYEFTAHDSPAFWAEEIYHALSAPHGNKICYARGSIQKRRT